ncbi:MAG: hopanoid-associated sugar epimerase [Pseudomonadota bacterium]
MRVFLTGATGFIGYNLLLLLLARGHKVRALARPESAGVLAGLPIEITDGHLLDGDALARGCQGAEWVFHLAADYRLWTPDPEAMYATNVGGTRLVLEAAHRAGASRIVHTSSVGTIKVTPNGGIADENTLTQLEDLIGDYKRSKYLSEREALKLAARGAPVVVVCPSTPIGPHDFKPTPTGKIIVDFLNGKMFAYLASGLNLVHVRDVAEGMILAAERGRVGERYILGNRNLTLLEVFQRLSAISGVPCPRFRIPHGFALGLGHACKAVSALTGRKPLVPLDGVRMARNLMHFSAAKAVRELGLPQTPIDVALNEAVEWFTQHGHAKARVKSRPAHSPPSGTS